MKAYMVYDAQGACENYDVAWCDTATQAKLICYQSDILDDVPYIDLRANRAPYLDGMEKEPEMKVLYFKLKNGWWHDYGGIHLTSENVEGVSYEEFCEKYRKVEK